MHRTVFQRAQTILSRYESELVDITVHPLDGDPGLLHVRLTGDLETGFNFWRHVLAEVCTIGVSVLLLDTGRHPLGTRAAEYLAKWPSANRKHSRVGLTICTPETDISEALSEQVSQRGDALVHDMQTAIRLARQLATDSNVEVAATPPSPELQAFVRQLGPVPISDDLEYRMSQSAERPEVATVRLRGRIDNSLLGSIVGIGKLFYDAGFPLLHYDLADVVDATRLEFPDPYAKVKVVWGTNPGGGLELVAVSGYMHCQRLAIWLLSGGQPMSPQHANASWRFLLMEPNALAARLPRMPGQELVHQWFHAIEAWEQRVSEGLVQDGPIEIDWSEPEGPLYVSPAEEQSCPTCRGSVWEGVRDRALLRRNKSIGRPVFTGAAGCYSCPHCGSPVVVAFDGTVAHFDPPDQTWSSRQPQRPLPPLLPVSQT